MTDTSFRKGIAAIALALSATCLGAFAEPVDTAGNDHSLEVVDPTLRDLVALWIRSEKHAE